MSAWMVSKSHIDIMLRGMIDRGLPEQKATDVGRMLWNENLKSLQYRYPNDGDGDRPGPVSFRDSDVETYEYTDPGYGPSNAELRSILNCYSYQSCEHPGWESSDSYDYVGDLLTEIGEGPKSGPWGWDAEDIAQARLNGSAVTPDYLK